LRQDYYCQITAFIMPSKKTKTLTFEQSLTELETIVQNLEQGELSLEESINLFERGLTLSKLSQEKLQEAEQKISILLNENGQTQLKDFQLSEQDQAE
jgi:exodeoxyribonuclease VII small subunit